MNKNQLLKSPIQKVQQLKKSPRLYYQQKQQLQKYQITPSIQNFIQKYQNIKNKYNSNLNLYSNTNCFQEQYPQDKKYFIQSKKYYQIFNPKSQNNTHPSIKPINKIQNPHKNNPNQSHQSSNKLPNNPKQNYLATNSLNLQNTPKKQKYLQCKSTSLANNLQQIQLKKQKINPPSAFSKTQQFLSSPSKSNYLTLQPITTSQILLMKNSRDFQSKLTPKQQKNPSNLKQTMSTASTSSNKATKQFKLSDFEIGKNLGKGKFGKVKIAKHKKTGMIFSLKKINKQMVKQDNIIQQVIKQIKIQTFFNHGHIVKLYSIFDDKQSVYLLLQLCTQGNLYQHMQNIGIITQKQTSRIMKQICQAVYQLHINNIIHRDIKPENIVLCFGMAKICDFGWSTQFKGSMRQTFCGSPIYISPQLLRGQLYDQKVDLWALGVLGYQMMTGMDPFHITSQRDLTKIISDRIVYPKWLSQLAKQFLYKLLDKNPNARLNIQQLLNHPFLNLYL